MFQIYKLRQVPSWSELSSTTTLFIGAGAGPSHLIGVLAEVCIICICVTFYNNMSIRYVKLSNIFIIQSTVDITKSTGLPAKLQNI